MRFFLGQHTTISILTTTLMVACKKDNGPVLPANESANYLVSTIAGSGQSGRLDGMGSFASFTSPTAVATDAQNNIYVVDADNFSIRKITSAGLVSTIAGGTRGYADGIGSAAQFYDPRNIAVDLSGNIYVAEPTRIRKITPASVVTTLAGTTTSGFADGTGTSALFNSIQSIVTDAQGNIYVIDIDNTIAGSVIRFISPAGTVSGFYSPGLYLEKLAIDAQGNLFATETVYYGDDVIRKITPSKVMTQYAKIQSASCITVAGGNIYIIGSTSYANNFYYGIYRVNSNGSNTLITGPTTIGFSDGSGETAQFGSPVSIAGDSNGNLFIADRPNNRIRKVTRK